MKNEKIRVITTKKNIPENTVSYPGFHLLNMGEQGMWLVDEQHPGYRRCRIKAIQIAQARGEKDLVERYSKLSEGTYEKKFPTLQEIIETDKIEHEKLKKASKEEKSA